jgi:hypothetical protein
MILLYDSFILETKRVDQTSLLCYFVNRKRVDISKILRDGTNLLVSINIEDYLVNMPLFFYVVALVLSSLI